MTKIRPRLLRGGRLLDGERWCGERADMLLIDGAIAAVATDLGAGPDGAEIIECGDSLIHPGLINGHTHGHGSLAKGTGDRWSLEILLAAGPWISGKRAPEDRYLAARLNAAEMALKGVTACYDLFFEIPAPTVEGITEAARAYGDVGLRVTMAPMLADRSLYQVVSGLRAFLPEDLRNQVDAMAPRSWEETMASVERLARGWSLDTDRAKLALAPTIPMHCSDEFIRACRHLGEEFGLGLHSHVSESKVQLLTAEERYGTSIVGHLRELGLLNERFTAAHGVWLSDQDMAWLGEAGASVAVNPGSNMRLGNGLPDTARMLSHGINVAVGTDGSNSSDNQNMYEAIRATTYASRILDPRPETWLSARQTLRAATIGGARSLGFGETIGTLRVGARADLVFLDLTSINWLPVNEPTNQIVHVEDGLSVRDVMVDGDYIVRDRALTRVDMTDLARQVGEARIRLDGLTMPEKHLFDRLEPLVAQYCGGLACRHHALHCYCR